MPNQKSNGVFTSPNPKQPLGQTPAVLAKRKIVEDNSSWCPITKSNVEFDPWCDPLNPKTILYKDVVKANTTIKDVILETPIVKSKQSHRFGLNLYYKFEIFHRTGSFNERGALYSLLMLSEEQKRIGVITASLGNWAMALAYYGQTLDIPVTVVLPMCTELVIIEKCENFGANVVLSGSDLAESKKHAFSLYAETGRIYINGSDHPHVIAGAGTIGIEILKQLPETDAILIPVGGGGLLAGIATLVKQYKPEVLIYGVEPEKCCCFSKALEHKRPHQTEVSRSLAERLAVSTAGCNAFHTAQSLIDKMVLVEDDNIARAILHLVEEENLVAEGAGACSLSALMSVPDILPELKEKNVVCVITGGNIDHVILPRCLERAKAVEGRIIKLTVTLPVNGTKEQLKVLSMIANVGGNVINSYIDHAWLTDSDIFNIYLNLIIETYSLEHACTLKRVMERLFPDICNFLEEPFSPIPMCGCFPKRFP